MRTECYRRGQVEVGVIGHEGRVFFAFGSGVVGHNVTGYTSRHQGGIFALKRWSGGTMLACRCEVVGEYHDGSLALMFRLRNRRFIVGYALGEEGMLFRGELLPGCDEERARREARSLAEYWAGIDAEDEADPWHGEPGGPDEGDW